jgi:fatty-acyl-CoA synthase
VLTHANCFWTNLSLDLGCGLHADDVVLQVLPQFHVGGWNVQPLLAWWKGATVVLTAAFDAGAALRLIGERRVTTMMGVPATYLFMAEHPDFATTDLGGLRQVVVGGAPMPEPLLEVWLSRGVRIVQGYGLTEAAPNVLCLPPEYAAGRVGWAGRPYPHVDVALRDTESGALVDGPGRGELLVRGPNVFAGYWRDPGAGRAAVSGGWLRTGDVAERDAEGFYRIRDRVKDMYVSGGENVYPAEVESVLHAHPDIADAAVIGVPDDRWGEVGCAFVVPRPGARVEAEELIAHCRGRLASFKVPRHVRTVDRLPRSAVDKVLKTELRARYERAVSGPRSGPGGA